MGQVGCYSLHLYCDGPNHVRLDNTPTAEFNGRTYGDCKREAKRDGWIIDLKRAGRESGYALCPDCRNQERTKR